LSSSSSSSKLRRILVTGGAGYLGSALVRRLVAGGAVVRVLDDLSRGRRDRLVGVPCDLVVGDVSSIDAVRGAARGIDAILHLAAPTPDARTFQDERRAHEITVTGTINVCAAAAEARVRRVVFVSSAAVYGARLPYLLHEDVLAQPTSLEGAQKLAAETYLKVYGGRSAGGFATTILRLFSLYGPHQEADGGVVSRFVAEARLGKPATIFGDGTQTRDFIHLDDAVSGVVAALEAPGGANRTFNLASGEPVSVRHIAALLADLGKVSAPPKYAPARPGEAHDVKASIGAASAALGFRPRVKLRDGLVGCMTTSRSFARGTGPVGLFGDRPPSWAAPDTDDDGETEIEIIYTEDTT
jgi:UDP-glucose 4-epimerase